MYPKEGTYQEDQVEELMEIFRDILFCPSILERHEIPESVKALTYYPNNFYKNYPYLFHEDRSYNINSFEQIGMLDPLENEKGDSLFFPPTKPDDLVYSRERYSPDESPAFTFLPKKLLMLKMIRACVDVYDPSELWYKECKECAEAKQTE